MFTFILDAKVLVNVSATVMELVTTLAVITTSAVIDHVVPVVAADAVGVVEEDVVAVEVETETKLRHLKKIWIKN